MLKNLRLRLLREMPWDSANALAEEIYAALSDEDSPQEIPEGIRLTARDGVPPIQVVDYGDEGTDIPVMKITRGDEVVNINLSNNQLVTQTEGSPSSSTPEEGESSGGNIFPGQVVAHLGSNRYTMAVYLSGRTRAATNLTVTQLEGDAAFPHAVGRWAYVIKEPDSTYSMIIPVWG